jgi:hypothetical protein
VHLSACRQPGLSDTPNDPGIVLTIYHFGVKYTILKQKKTAPVEAGQVSREQTKKRTNKALDVHCEIAAPPTYHLISVLVNILYPPHEHIFAKGVFHGIYPSSN